jgi:hypothetical protein
MFFGDRGPVAESVPRGWTRGYRIIAEGVAIILMSACRKAAAARKG